MTLIDARNDDLQGLLKKLKDITSSAHCTEMEIDILVTNESDAKHVKGFITMSGGRTEIDKKDNFYIIHVTGHVCCA